MKMQKGLWSQQPFDETSSVPGELNFAEKSLVVFGKRKLLTTGTANFTIHGFIPGTGAITLLECYSGSSTRYPDSGFSNEEYHAHTIIKGSHYKDATEIKYYGYSAKIGGLLEWLKLSNVESDIKDGKSLITVVHQRNAASIDTNLGKLEIYIASGESHHPLGTVPFTCEQHATIDFIFNSPIDLDGLSKHVWKIKNLIALLSQNKVQIESLNCYKSKPDPTNPSSFESDTVTSFMIKSDPIKFERFNVMVEFDTIKEYFSKLVNSWLSMYDVHEPMLVNYFAANFAFDLPLESKFKTISQSIEHLHRIVHPGAKFTKDEFDSMISQMISVVPEAYRQWWLDRLRNLNAPSLRERVNELMADFSEIWSLSPERDMLPKYIADTRNYLTHHGKAKKSILDPTQIWRVSSQIKALFEMHVYVIIGIPRDRVVYIYQNHHLSRTMIAASISALDSQE